MTSPGSENKNHSILLAPRSLSLELVNEDAEKYPPNSTKTHVTFRHPLSLGTLKIKIIHFTIRHQDWPNHAKCGLREPKITSYRPDSAKWRCQTRDAQNGTGNDLK